MEEEVIELNPRDLLTLSSGKDKNEGFYRGAGNITIDEVLPEGETKNLEEVQLNCEFNFFCEGGAIVVQCDFEKEFMFQSNQLMNICAKHFETKINNPDDNTILSLLIIPILLRGDISFVLTGLTYYFGIDLGDKKRVVIVFDNTLTQVFSIEGIDFREIQMEIENDLLNQKKELEEEYLKVEAEVKKLEGEGMYKDMVKETMESITNENILINGKDGENNV